ncbi:hypothetical protein [Virgibacillus salidurans]|uniref:hypothetical protein n=1 Tax=Virgibacillus salidurans TaxID=2831673 RepID=UPI001F3F729B|nr:hypothetical protein [Virgibacillus sp. NKC19-16]
MSAGEDIIVTKSGKDTAKIMACYDPDYVKEEQPAYRSSDGWVTYEEFLELRRKRSKGLN